MGLLAQEYVARRWSGRALLVRVGDHKSRSELIPPGSAVHFLCSRRM